MYHLLRFFLCCLLVSAFAPASINAQTTEWGHKIGTGGTGRGYMVKVAPNGNVYVAGYFSGTTDLDPSAGVYNITSAGSEDAFLACYTPAGALLWGFRIGGTSIDAVMGLDFDQQNNVIIVGYFRGTNVDFNPAAGTAFLTDNGIMGSANWGGDGFVAKYDVNGNYQWAFQIGGPWVYDGAESVATDAQGNIYVGGCILDDADLDPSVNTLMINGAINGRGYLCKYTPGGQIIWGFGFLSQGVGGTDCGVRSMVLRGGEIYISGFVEEFSDFDPSANVASWTTNSLGDPYIAKYDTAGNYIFHYVASGNTFEDAQHLTLDPAGNIYVTGYTSGSNLAFGTNVVTAPGGGGNADIFLAKFTNAGALIWARMMGANQEDVGTGITYADNHFFVTGYFSGTVDFDPGVGVQNLVSAGSTDIYTVKYDLNGNYVCGFRTGSTGADRGWAINPDAQNNIYESGEFINTVDFDPSAQPYNLTATGTNNAFVVKYLYAIGSPDIIVAGDTICSGEQAYITVTDTANGGSITITVNDGSSNYTFTVQSGVPFALVPSPTVTTTYTWSVGGGQSACLSSGGSGSFTVTVNPNPTANAGPDVTVCNNTPVQLSGSGGNTYSWTPGGFLSSPTVANPSVTATDTTITFTMVTTNTFGCSDTDQVVVSIHQGVAVANAGPDTSACPGVAVLLQGSGNGSYLWYPANGLNNTTIANPVFTGGTTSTIYLVVTDQYNCRDTDDVVITMLPQPIADAGPDQQICPGTSVTLQASGGNSYSWYPTAGMAGSNTANPTVTVANSTTYYVVVSNGIGCTDTDAVNITVIAAPPFGVIPDRNLCPGDSVWLYATGGSSYHWYPEFNISGNGNDSVLVWPGATTTYYVAVTSTVCNVADTLFTTVNVQPSPNVSIVQAGPKLCGAAYAQLSATGALSYTWSPAATLDSPGIASPRSTALTDTWYKVTGYSEHGCAAIDSVLLRVESDNFHGLFVPSVFSPNDDGKNDCYRILLPQGISDYELHIYNRWGNNVYNADDPGDCWDGYYNGEPCDVGVYFYYYRFKSDKCRAVKEGKGDITLLR